MGGYRLTFPGSLTSCGMKDKPFVTHKALDLLAQPVPYPVPPPSALAPLLLSPPLPILFSVPECRVFPSGRTHSSNKAPVNRPFSESLP